MKEFTTKVVVKKGNEYIKFRIECFDFSLAESYLVVLSKWNNH
ncbi:hypothetical protein BSPWISOXPB_4415 [uncultured Gammaproteobacteria bacterium]|nr:hypothetical protein BSPWISOXPB_4415 [uncultured Gammaproteobacteria bacterium]